MPDIKLSPEQESAFALCTDMNERVVSVTGPAGCGKTLVLGMAYREIAKQHQAVLCAPTGRAAKRISELTGLPAVTIHRLLEFPQPHEEGDPTEPKRNHWRPIEQRIVFVDEASMIGPTLYEQLMEALPKNGLIRFFGDNNQLPPVEKGDAPFIKLLQDKPAVTLTFNYRSDDAIITNARRILQGSVPVRNNRFEILYTSDPVKQLREFATPEFCQPDHQIIVPTRRGNFGTLRINPSLQAKFNGTGPILRLDRFNDEEAPLTVRAGDKFLWVKNDYNLNLFNGETGHIATIDVEDGSLGLVTGDGNEVNVPARLRTYSAYHGSHIQYDPRKQLELGYAITTHKAQGSEFKVVVVCLCRQHAWMLNRRNFYTAVTRAKERVIVICETTAMRYAVRSYKA